MLTVDALRSLISRLDGEPADALESETLEFKSGNASGREAVRSQLRAIRETVVGFANANGGTLVLGVADHAASRADAIVGVVGLDTQGIKNSIYDGTDPPILVDIEELSEPEGRLLMIRVPRGIPPHTTTEGVAKIRVGKTTKPLTGSNLARMKFVSGNNDPTAEIVPGAFPELIDPLQVDRLRRFIAQENSGSGLKALGDVELLDALELTAGSDVTFAAVLLVGHKSAIRRTAPQHELTIARFKDEIEYDYRRDLRVPLLETLEEVRSFADANARVEIIGTSGFRQLDVPDFSWWVIREALLNALVHRDYFLGVSTHMNLFANRLEIVSPGGFIGGVSPQNVIRHAPVRRNPLLADVLQSLGIVNRAGLGVDRIFRDQLRLGKEFPLYDANESYVRLVLYKTTHRDFVRFVDEQAIQGQELSLDDLIVLRSLIDRGHINRRSAADVLNLPENTASQRLVSLRERGHLSVNGRGAASTYRLRDDLAHWVNDRGNGGVGPRSETELRDHVLAAITEHGVITNADIRHISGISRSEVVRLTRAMREEGLIEVRGRGRGAHYVLPE